MINSIQKNDSSTTLVIKPHTTPENQNHEQLVQRIAQELQYRSEKSAIKAERFIISTAEDPRSITLTNHPRSESPTRKIIAITDRLQPLALEDHPRPITPEVPIDRPSPQVNFHLGLEGVAGMMADLTRMQDVLTRMQNEARRQQDEATKQQAEARRLQDEARRTQTTATDCFTGMHDICERRISAVNTQLTAYETEISNATTGELKQAQQ